MRISLSTSSSSPNFLTFGPMIISVPLSLMAMRVRYTAWGGSETKLDCGVDFLSHLVAQPRALELVRVEIHDDFVQLVVEQRHVDLGKAALAVFQSEYSAICSIFCV